MPMVTSRDRCLSASDVSNIYADRPGGYVAKETDLDANGMINLGDFARFAHDWMQSN